MRQSAYSLKGSDMNQYKAHEIRMWIQNIVIPAVGIGAYILSTNPELKDRLKNMVNFEAIKEDNKPLTLKTKFNNPFKKEH